MANDKMIRNVILILMLAALLVVVGCSNSNNALGELDSFAQCLTENNVKMYGTEWCSHCKNQKAMFGTSFQYVDYIDCDKNKEVCEIAGITGYPTWEVEEKLYPGEQQLNNLATLSGCELS